MNTQTLQQAIEQELKDTEDRLDSDLYMNDAMYNRLTGLAQAYEWVLDQMKQLQVEDTPVKGVDFTKINPMDLAFTPEQLEQLKNI